MERCCWNSLLALHATIIGLLCSYAVSGALPTFDGGRCGEYCSYSHVKGYVGPLDTAQNLKDALDSVSYKREIVLVHHAQLDYAYQALRRWQRFGYGHVLLVFPERGPCDRLQRSGAFAKLACGWYSDNSTMGWVMSQGGGCKGCTDKWVIHYTGARTVRRGYNTLVADADAGPLYDWYRFIRTPPYDGVTLWHQREGNFNTNGGFYYVQNASRSGPVAYMLYDHILKNVRWFEDISPLRVAVGLAPSDGSTGLAPGQLCNDQASLSDSLHGGVLGRPQVYECVFWYHPSREAWEKRHLDDYAAHGQRLYPDSAFGPYQMQDVAVHPELHAGSGGAERGQLVGAELRVPHPGPGGAAAWDAGLGGYPFARGPDGRGALGPMARRVAELFNEEGPGTPFPDPADPADASAASALPPERFAYLPPWLANTHGFGPHNAGGAGWYADALNGGRAAAAATHLHAGLPPGDYSKVVTLALEMPGGWDLGLGAAVEGSAAPYLATAAFGHVPPLLAFAAGAVGQDVDAAEFGRLVQGLVRLALSLHRVVVWPWLPCAAPLLRREGAARDPAAQGHAVPWDTYLNTTTALPNGMGAASLQDLQCLVTWYDKHSCLRGGARPGAPHSAPRGLLPHEFDHWLEGQRRGRRGQGAGQQGAGGRLLAQSGAGRAPGAAGDGRAATAAAAAAGEADLEPGPHNTVQDLVPGQPPAGPGPAPLLTLSPAQLAALAAHPAASRAPVLWLRGPVAVPELPSPDHAKLYARMAAMCCALSDTLPPGRECMDRPPGAQVAPA